MGKIDTVVKSEIIRLAKKELRAACGPLARNVRQLKRTVSQLRKTVAALEKAGKEWTKQARAQKAELQATEEEVKTARFSPGLVRSLRKKLGVSQTGLSRLTGISKVTIASWEQGKARPSQPKRALLVAARKMGKREVQEILKLKAAAEPAKPKKRKPRRKPKAKKKK